MTDAELTELRHQLTRQELAEIAGWFSGRCPELFAEIAQRILTERTD